MKFPKLLSKLCNVIMVASLLLLVSESFCLKEVIDSDVCMDRGGSYNYLLDKCDQGPHVLSNEYIPCKERRNLVEMSFLFLIGCVAFVVGRRLKKNN